MACSPNSSSDSWSNLIPPFLLQPCDGRLKNGFGAMRDGERTIFHYFKLNCFATFQNMRVAEFKEGRELTLTIHNARPISVDNPKYPFVPKNAISEHRNRLRSRKYAKRFSDGRTIDMENCGYPRHTNDGAADLFQRFNLIKTFHEFLHQSEY